MLYLKHMASHDQLTGLPGRPLLRERIAEAIEKATAHGRKAAVFVVDLDHFKWMNDSLGHKAGDEVLVGTADRMQQSLRRLDTLGRCGDEFVIVILAGIPNLYRQGDLGVGRSPRPENRVRPHVRVPRFHCDRRLWLAFQAKAFPNASHATWQGYYLLD